MSILFGIALVIGVCGWQVGWALYLTRYRRGLDPFVIWTICSPGSLLLAVLATLAAT